MCLAACMHVLVACFAVSFCVCVCVHVCMLSRLNVCLSFCMLVVATYKMYIQVGRRHLHIISKFIDST